MPIVGRLFCCGSVVQSQLSYCVVCISSFKSAELRFDKYTCSVSTISNADALLEGLSSSS